MVWSMKYVVEDLIVKGSPADIKISNKFSSQSMQVVEWFD